MTAATAPKPFRPDPRDSIIYLIDPDPDGVAILYYDPKNPAWDGRVAYGAKPDGSVSRERFDVEVLPALDDFDFDYWYAEGYASAGR